MEWIRVYEMLQVLDKATTLTVLLICAYTAVISGLPVRAGEPMGRMGHRVSMSSSPWVHGPPGTGA